MVSSMDKKQQEYIEYFNEKSWRYRFDNSEYFKQEDYPDDRFACKCGRDARREIYEKKLDWDHHAAEIEKIIKKWHKIALKGPTE